MAETFATLGEMLLKNYTSTYITEIKNFSAPTYSSLLDEMYKTLSGSIKYIEIFKGKTGDFPASVKVNFFHDCGPRGGKYAIWQKSGKCSKCKKYIGTKKNLMTALKMKEFKNQGKNSETGFHFPVRIGPR